jgi:hypothetical protein
MLLYKENSEIPRRVSTVQLPPAVKTSDLVGLGLAEYSGRKQTLNSLIVKFVPGTAQIFFTFVRIVGLHEPIAGVLRVGQVPAIELYWLPVFARRLA